MLLASADCDKTELEFMFVSIDGIKQSNYVSTYTLTSLSFGEPISEP